MMNENDEGASVNSEMIVERVIDKYFEDNPNAFVQHHLVSYNIFL